jgi:CDP-diacylglycerol--glycerol-3-phosphate 3-phosphatidyltransferase
VAAYDANSLGMWTIPNILTAGRLAAAPGVALAFAAFDRPTADVVAAAIFVVAAATDWLDGRLARAWRQESAVGRMLDPIADKAIVAIALAALCGLYGLGWSVSAPVAAILLRETAVAGLREFLSDGFRLPVTRLAKWKTTVQMTAIALLLAAGALGEARGAAEAAGFAILWLAAALTLATGWDYFSRGVAHLRRMEG